MDESKAKKRREATRLWRLRNKEAVRIKDALYRSENIERIRARDAKKKRDYRAMFPEKHKMERAAYKAGNTEKLRESERRYKQANKTRARELHKEWVKNNPVKVKLIAARKRIVNADDIRARNSARRALARGATVGECSSIRAWERKWRILRKVRCYWCTVSAPPDKCHTDHIVALSNGGKHTLTNLCISCAPCNLKKSNLSVQKWNQNLTQPVLL